VEHSCCVGFVLATYRFGWSSTGFLNKSLWDWLQLLIVPLVLAVVALVFQLANSRTERQLAQQRYELDQQIALDKQREDRFQAYLDCLAELMLDKQLRSSAEDAEVRHFARVRTLTVLRRLDAERKGSVLQFLQEAELINNDEAIIGLHGADLRGAYLRETDLRQIGLRGANLTNATLEGAKLTFADLQGAILEGAKLTFANLREADLSHATILREQLVEAKSLKGAILLDGSKHPQGTRNTFLTG
jgi:hypothetical protein